MATTVKRHFTHKFQGAASNARFQSERGGGGGEDTCTQLSHHTGQWSGVEACYVASVIVMTLSHARFSRACCVCQLHPSDCGDGPASCKAQHGHHRLAAAAVGTRNFNILAFAGLLAIATTVGGVLLTDAVDVGEENVKGVSAQLQQLTSQPVDENSKLLLQVVVALFGVTAVGVGEFYLPVSCCPGDVQCAYRCLACDRNPSGASSLITLCVYLRHTTACAGDLMLLHAEARLCMHASIFLPA